MSVFVSRSAPFAHEVRDEWGHRSRLAGLTRRVAYFAALLFVIAAGAHRARYLETPALIANLGLVAALALVALALAALALVRIWNRGDRGASDALKAAVVALAVLAPFAAAGAKALTYPILNDISTDADSPPSLSDADAASPFPEEQAKLQQDAYPEVAGRRYPVPLERTIEAVEALFQAEGWDVGPPQVGPGEATLRATAYTAVLGFPSDVAVRIADEGETSFVDMRSRSRFGEHDLGDNAARIADFLAELDKATAVRASAPPTPGS